MRTAIRAVVAAAALLLPAIGAAQVPQTVPYQGFLADAQGTPIDGSVSLTIRVYDTANAPNPVWQETLAGVPVVAGYFAVDLGVITPLAADVRAGRTRYLGISVNGDPEATPRQVVGSVPYALMAYDAERLGGRPPADFVTVERVNELINDRNFVSEDRVRELVGDGGNGGGGLDTAAVNALIDARGYLNEAAIIALISGRGYLDADAVNALIDARGYLNTAAVNALIDARGYLSEAAINALIDARNYLNEAAVNALIDARNYLNADAVNALIDARNYVTEAEVQAIVDARVDARIDALRTELLERIVQGGQAYILGRSAQTSSGRVSFNGSNGIAGADAMCRATFGNEPTAHLCTSDEVQRSLAAGTYNRDNAFTNVETWTVQNGVRGATYANSHSNSCQSLLYNSADAGRGSTLRVRLNTASNGGGGGVAGHQIEYVMDRACNLTLPMLCCR